jgi:hypothetical protein
MCGPTLNTPADILPEVTTGGNPLKRKFGEISNDSPTLFPQDMEVRDISFLLGTQIQTENETKTLGGGYCYMWMLWLSLKVAENEAIWNKTTKFFGRMCAYTAIYDAGRKFVSERNVSGMADEVIAIVDKHNGKTRSQQCRIVKGTKGKPTNTQGDPFKGDVNKKFGEPIRETLLKNVGDKFYIPPITHKGYDLFVQSTDSRFSNLCTKQLKESIAKNDKPVLMNILVQPAAGATSSHALAGIYFPGTYMPGGKPEFHILTTYKILDQDRNTIKTMTPHVFQPTATAGRRKTQRRNMRKKRKQTSKRMR